MKKQQGFTLIEIAIVLVIIGLLLGGVLKGQELITSARVRNLISQQDGIKAAYFGFLDRYRSLPGDYSQATSNIPNCAAATCPNGDGNGQVDAGNESVASWSHLSKAGFITGNYDFNAVESSATTPTNPYGSLIRLIYDNVYRDAASDTGSSRHNLKTGNNVPSDILAEVDRKIDDGAANAGQFRHSTYGTTTYATCAVAATNLWQSQTPVANCGGASLF
ncbi:MAG: prepilin-type N-terminal cleavage/methylation domain-containing protein [Betaproteobacteria bacterium]|nr:prepilin-type N-terminal cleavage/methylation domain-containing protein [Betaproteobacteria bacterium]